MMKLLVIFLLFLSFSSHTRTDCNEIYRILDTALEGAQARVDIVQQAKEEILTSYFIFNKDRTGMAGLALLTQAAQQNKKVKVIFDDDFNEISLGLMKVLEDSGVEVKIFHPTFAPGSFWDKVKSSDYSFGDYTAEQIFKLTHRMHDKMLIVDGEIPVEEGGQIFITGGRNVKGDYFEQYQKNYDDRDVLIQSPAVADARNYYLNLWDSQSVSSPNYKKLSRTKYEEAKVQLQEASKILEESEFIRSNTGYDWTDVSYKTSGIKFLSDGIENGVVDPTKLSDTLAEYAMNAQVSIQIETPYLIPTVRLMKIFKEKLQIPGFKVQVLTNSINSTDGMVAQAAYELKKKELLEMGVELYEYQGPNYLHAKSAVIDGEYAFIGTYNMDPRSANLNTEVAVVVKDVLIAGELLESFTRNLDESVSRKIDPETLEPEGGYLYPVPRKKKFWLSFYKKLIKTFPILYQQL